MSKQRVFLAYRPSDLPFVDSVRESLRDSELGPAHFYEPAKWRGNSDDVRKAIIDSIRKADAVLVFWSDHAAKSPWVQYEIGMAQALDIPIRVLIAADSQAKLPSGLTKKDVIKLDLPDRADIVSPRPSREAAAKKKRQLAERR
jgi:hypothetical protein